RGHRSLDAGADVEGARDVRPLEGEHVGARDVLYVDEIPCLRAVPVDDEGLPREETIAEDGDHARFAVWILARAVDVGVAQRDAAHSPQSAQGLHVLLEGDLGDAVGRSGTTRMRLGCRDALGVAVARSAAR